MLSCRRGARRAARSSTRASVIGPGDGTRRRADGRRAYSRSSPRSHSLDRTPASRLARPRPASSSARAACAGSTWSTSPRTRHSSGSAETSSARRWSRNGARASSDAAMRHAVGALEQVVGQPARLVDVQRAAHAFGAGRAAARFVTGGKAFSVAVAQHPEPATRARASRSCGGSRARSAVRALAQNVAAERSRRGIPAEHSAIWRRRRRGRRALAREHRLHLRAASSAMKCSATSAGSASRRVAPRHRFGRRADQIARREHDLVVLGAEVLRHLRGARSSLWRSSAKPREKVSTFGAGCGEREQRRRIEAAGEQDAAAPRSRSSTASSSVSDESRRAESASLCSASGWRRAAPVARSRAGGRTATAPWLAGRELADAGEQGARAGHVAVAPGSRAPRRIGCASDARAFAQRPQLRGEIQHAALLVQVERLLAEAVAGEEQPLLARVPQRERERAAQVRARTSLSQCS